jgi:membrane-associated phospholipid phosphatase
LRNRTLLVHILVTAILGTTNQVHAQASADPGPGSPDTSLPEPTAPVPATEPGAQNPGLGTDIKLYFTAPLRWNLTDWAWFGGALAAIGAAHHFDTQVRTHFTQNLKPGQTINSDDVQDIIPAVGVLGLTWGYAYWTGDSSGEHEAWAMLEAAGLSSATAYALKYTARRLGPDETSDPNEWFKSGGKSFPSEHSAAAFAVGTVLAESGNDDYRWVRRFLGYGLGVVTSYLRLEHNAHWLSDTVAGAALGISTGRFTMKRPSDSALSGLSVEPVPGGAMLTYRLTLQ